MTENPRPRPSRGVMGYVAELQQFDPVPPYVYDLHPAEPPTRPLPPPALVPSPPRAAPGPIVSHIRQRPQRRTRIAIIAAAAVSILAGAGLSYAALGGFSDTPRSQARGAAPSTVPTDGLLPLDPALPGSEPIAARTTDPATTTTTAATTTTTTGTSDLAQPLPDAVTTPGAPGPGQSPPAATAAPTEPAATQPAVAPAPPLPLAATISHVADTAEDGFLGYAGTVSIENPGVRDVTGWRLTLTVPGGNTVTATGASVAQDGETVTFTPAGEAAVPAGSAVTFTFQVAGLLTALPGGCVIDGSPCS